MTFVYITLSLLFTFLLIYIFAGYFIARKISRRGYERPNTFDGMFKENHCSSETMERLRSDYSWFDNTRDEDIQIFSKDGLKLSAAVIRTASPAPKGVVIMFHGYRSSPRRDFCIQMRILSDAGYHLIVPDQRSHGMSQGKYICYGVQERYDAMLWRKKAAELFGEDFPTALMGLSMGGATVLMASSLAEAEDGALRCIVADCPFSSTWDIVAYVMKRKHKLPPSPLFFTSNLWCRALARLDLKAESSADCVKKSKLPILIFHGDADKYVPIHHSEEIAKAAPKRVTLSVYPKADHGEAVFYDEARYKKELLEFLEKHM